MDFKKTTTFLLIQNFSMSLLNVLFVLVVVGFLLLLVNKYIPMDSRIKNILNAVVVIVVILWLLRAFGVLDSLSQINI